MDKTIEMLEESLRQLRQADEELWHKGEKAARNSISTAQMHIKLAIRLQEKQDGDKQQTN